MQGFTATRNALLPGSSPGSGFGPAGYSVCPRVTFTDPEVGAAGYATAEEYEGGRGSSRGSSAGPSSNEGAGAGAGAGATATGTNGTEPAAFVSAARIFLPLARKVKRRMRSFFEP